jgi:malyl-CoA/(S)-citramalyl-CoA lyase
MSFTDMPPHTNRLHRSELAVPGSNPNLFEKAARTAADVVFLDLEDAVAPDDKEQARRNVIAALNDIDWGRKTLNVRINGLDTPWMYRDVIEIVEHCPRLDLLFIPKIGVAADVYALDMLVSQVELAVKRERRVGFEIMIETALGMVNVEAIAQASRRLEAMCFGPGDFAAATGARSTEIGAVNSDYGVLAAKEAGGSREFYLADQWHAAQTRILYACRAYGLRAIDGPFSDFRDTAGFLASARRTAAIGYEGRMVIHPSQIALANEVYSPASQEVEQARRIVAAMKRATREGKGAVGLDGRMIDIANLRMAEKLIARAEAIAAGEAG